MSAGNVTGRRAACAALILACAPGFVSAASPATPAAVGLAVPGMPVGSPGMDGAAYGGRKDSFDVLLLAKDGTSKVYRRYEGKKS